MADRATVTVALTVDLEAARKAGKVMMASNFLAQFKAQGEDWQREVSADPLLQTILQVKISAQ